MKMKTKMKQKTEAKSKSKKIGKSLSKGKSESNDIIQVILQDHKPLKQLIKILKDSEVEFLEKKPAFEEFAPLLLSHAEPEQESLYVHMKEEDELRAEGFEGDTEHAIASRLIEEINQSSEEDEWMAKVKVLAELVEHHIKEEENDMFKDVRKELSAEERIAIGEEYIRLRDDYRMQNATPVAQTKKSTEARVH